MSDKLDMEQLLSHHDLVFASPVCDPTYGLPLGDGDSGALVWFLEDRLVIELGKTDLWDNASECSGSVITESGEDLTTCRGGARLTLDLGCPAFGNIYQDDFEARLRLHDAIASIRSRTPFCGTDMKIFSSRENRVTVVEADISYNEDIPAAIKLERWGSRTFSYWYSRFCSGTSTGLTGTGTDIRDGCALVTQRMNGGCFTAALLPVCGAEHILSVRGSHVVGCDFSAASRLRLTLYMTVTVGKDADESENAAVRRLSDAAAKGFEAIYDKHAEEWRGFWEKSYVSLPEDQDYIENLWYLNLYYANCSMRGTYPAHFCNGIWSFYHDFVPWNSYFHYNMQLATFPLDVANHPELLNTYCDFRSRQLPVVKEYAEKHKHTRGAFYTDVCDRFGRNSDNTRDNCTCGSQIAMMLYRHYQFTGDEEFLREKALPVMRETALFYLDKFVKEEDGKYHIHGTQCYEGSPMFDDSITDHAMLRALFTALGEVMEEEEYRPYREVLDNIAPYMVTDMYDDETKDGVFTRGIGKGLPARGNKVLSVGLKDGVKFRRTFGNPANDYYGFPDTEMAPLFPSGNVGIKDSGSDVFDMIYNSLCLHHPVIPPDRSDGWDNPDGICMGWCMLPIYLARMGMSGLLKTVLDDTASTWIVYPNGFGNYGPYEDVGTGVIGIRSRWAKNTLTNLATGEKSEAFQWNFRHFDYETLPIIATAVNEMLVQSHDGTVRLFPAVRREKRYNFSLAAAGGFMIDAEYSDGSCDVRIRATRGGCLRLAIDNVDSVPAFTLNGCPIRVRHNSELFITDMSAGDELGVKNENGNFSGLRAYPRNDGLKKIGNSVLGTGKEYR